MITLTIDNEGELTLGEDILSYLRVAPGQQIIAEKLPNGRIVLRAASGKVSDAFGALRREGQPTLTIEEMNEAIARGWAGEQ